MKVAMIAPMKSYGGIERTFVTLANEFAKKEITTTLAMLRNSCVPYPDELSERVVVRNLRTRSKRDGIGRVADFVRVEQPDVIITAKDHGAQVVLLSRMIHRWNVPVFVTVTNMWSRVVRRPLQRLFVRWLYPKANGIIAVSSGVKDDLCDAFGLPRSQVRVIFNPVAPWTPGSHETGSSPHPWLEEGSNTPVILAIGRLEQQKDFPTLMRAFARMRMERDRSCRLIIIGEGTQREELEKLARELDIVDDFALPGKVTSAIPFLRRASLFVLSSRWEGFGIVIAEALAAGTPVVATNCASGPAEILENGRFGRLVPVGDAAALADAMREALDAPGDRENLMSAADRFAPSRIATDYLEYMELARTGARN